MRLGISATSPSEPNCLRMRLRPLKVSAISAPRPSRAKADVSMLGAGQVAGAPHWKITVHSYRHPGGGRAGRPAGQLFRHRPARRLPDLDSGALVLELLFDLGGFFFVDSILDGLATRLDQILRLLEAEPGDGAHLLDDVNLLLAAGLQDDGEFRLFLDCRGGSGTGCGSNGHRSGGGNAPLLLQKL